MEIFRHYYTEAELNTNNFFKQHMNNFGFCNLDGSKINYAMPNTSSTGTTTSIRYKLDTKKQTYLYYDENRGDRYSLNGWTHELSDIGVRLSNNEVKYATYQQKIDVSEHTSAATVIFLPLKNNGFLLNIRSLTLQYVSFTPNPSNSSNDIRDKGFLINTPTPSLNVKIYGQNPMYVHSVGNNTGVFNLIGLPPCKANANWTYILYTSATMGDSSHSNYNYKLIDYGDGKVLDLPFVSNFIREYNSSTPAYNELTYTNVNNNICSMIKLPYDNGYIDGVYLLTTAPQQLEDATFFSFDGRNFLNVFDNYVLELPPSTT